MAALPDSNRSGGLPRRSKPFLGPQAGRGWQQTGPVNWRKRRIRCENGPRLVTGALRPRAAAHSTEKGENRKTCQMFGLRAWSCGRPMLSTKRVGKLEVEALAPLRGCLPNFPEESRTARETRLGATGWTPDERMTLPNRRAVSARKPVSAPRIGLPDDVGPIRQRAPPHV